MSFQLHNLTQHDQISNNKLYNLSSTIKTTQKITVTTNKLPVPRSCAIVANIFAIRLTSDQFFGLTRYDIVPN